MIRYVLLVDCGEMLFMLRNMLATLVDLSFINRNVVILPWYHNVDELKSYTKEYEFTIRLPCRLYRNVKLKGRWLICFELTATASFLQLH